MTEQLTLKELLPSCLASMRRRRRLSQEELGKRMGVGRRRIAYIEGAKNLTLRTIDRYLAALEYSTQDLLTLLSHELRLTEALGSSGGASPVAETAEAALSQAEAERLGADAARLKERLLDAEDQDVRQPAVNDETS